MAEDDGRVARRGSSMGVDLGHRATSHAPRGAPGMCHLFPFDFTRTYHGHDHNGFARRGVRRLAPIACRVRPGNAVGGYSLVKSRRNLPGTGRGNRGIGSDGFPPGVGRTPRGCVHRRLGELRRGAETCLRSRFFALRTARYNRAVAFESLRDDEGEGT